MLRVLKAVVSLTCKPLGGRRSEASYYCLDLRMFSCWRFQTARTGSGGSRRSRVCSGLQLLAAEDA
eukprot:8188421-Alexandrium_andersonii.AAC.1